MQKIRFFLKDKRNIYLAHLDNFTHREENEIAGDWYAYVAIDAIDAITRFVIAVVVGRRIQKTADKLLQIVYSRVAEYITIFFTSDDWDQYLPAIKKAFGFLWRPRRKAERRKKDIFYQEIYFMAL